MSMISDVVQFRRDAFSDFEKQPVLGLLCEGEVKNQLEDVKRAVINELSIAHISGDTPLPEEAEVRFEHLKRWFEKTRREWMEAQGINI